MLVVVVVVVVVVTNEYLCVGMSGRVVEGMREQKL